MYNPKVMDHFQHPRNVGDLPDANAVAEVGNPLCGDIMRLALKISDGRIEEARFKTFGCGAAIASSSIVTEMVKGKTVEQALRITNQQVAEALGGLPPLKIHCSVLAEQALQEAIRDYHIRQGKTPPPHPQPHEAFQGFPSEIPASKAPRQTRQQRAEG